MGGTFRSAMRPLSLLLCDPTHKASAVFSWGTSGQGSASCWSKVSHRSSAGQQLLVLGYCHDNSCSITTRGLRDLWGFVARHLLYHWLPQSASLIKIHFGNNFLETWNDSRESLTWGIRSPFSFIAKFLTEREASLKGTLPGSSYPIPHHSFPSFAGQQYSFLFWPKLQKVPQSFSFLNHLVEDCPVWFNIFKTKCFFVWNHSVHILTSLK